MTLAGGPTAHRPTEPIIESAFAFAGRVDDEGVDLEKRGDAQNPGCNHTCTGKVVIALDDDIGLYGTRQTEDG